MASAQTKPLEEKVADLKIGEKDEVPTDALHESVDGVKAAPNISAKNAFGDLNEAAKEAHEKRETSEKPSQQEVKIAEKEAEKSPDEGSYVVPAVDHRSVQEPGGEEKVEVPTAVVHENAGSSESPPQQGKGIIHSIKQSVKSVFSSVAGGSKGSKSSEAQGGTTTE